MEFERDVEQYLVREVERRGVGYRRKGVTEDARSI